MQVRTLKKNKEFQFVYRKGRGVASKDMTLVYAKSRYGGLRAGFSVSKKVGKSVVRNKVRRRLKEAYRGMAGTLCGNYGFIFIARPCIVEAQYSQLERQMRSLFKRAGIVRRDNT